MLYVSIKRINDMENIIVTIQEIVEYCNENLEKIDHTGHFEADDEVGFFFEEVKDLQNLFNELFESEGEEVRQCNIHPCSINCEWSIWENWSTCSKNCGGGISIRKRVIQKEAKYGGIPCLEYQSEEGEQCNIQPCNIDCECWSGRSRCTRLG